MKYAYAWNIPASSDIPTFIATPVPTKEQCVLRNTRMHLRRDFCDKVMIRVFRITAT
jgi:hypothetical protein